MPSKQIYHLVNWHIPSLALLFNRNQPFVGSEMSHLEVWSACICRWFCNQQNRIWKERQHTQLQSNCQQWNPVCSRPSTNCVNKMVLFVIVLMFPSAAAISNEAVTVRHIRGYLWKKSAKSFDVNIHFKCAFHCSSPHENWYIPNYAVCHCYYHC